jgi:hypothetical protein
LYYIPSKVTISWNPFILSGSAGDLTDSIVGWNVYRREAGQDYDFIKGFLKISTSTTMTIPNASTMTFTDTTAIAGKIYYYEVRPVDNSHKLPTYTPEVFSEVRVLAPTPNYSFVHRWMVNQEICNSMHMTTSTSNKVDPSHNYRCPYNGPGEGTGANAGFYDIGKDMLVDISESGCPYSSAPACDAVNGCTGIGSPDTVVSAAANKVYYDRSTGSCYINTSVGTGTSWSDFNTYGTPTVAIANLTNTALNAPLVKVTQPEAVAVCGKREIGTTYSNVLTGASPVGATNKLSLPSKIEYMGYSAFPLGVSDSTITDNEQGFSLNAQSRCNSSNANGLSTYYTDSEVPSTSFSYTLPGTASSNIRSLYTGSVPWASSYGTETCSSRYGIQDTTGNVAEWVKDQMTCTSNNKNCTSVAGTQLGDYKFKQSAPAGNPYAFDNLIGPFNDSDGNGPSVSDLFLDKWILRDQLYNASLFSFPIAMPMNATIKTDPTLKVEPAIPYILKIGLTAGITTSQLHEDDFTVNADQVYASASQTGSFAQGGSYLSGTGAGRYSSELIPLENSRPDVGFRCYFPIVPANYPTDSFHPYTAY